MTIIMPRNRQDRIFVTTQTMSVDYFGGETRIHNLHVSLLSSPPTPPNQRHHNRKHAERTTKS